LLTARDDTNGARVENLPRPTVIPTRSAQGGAGGSCRVPTTGAAPRRGRVARYHNPSTTIAPASAPAATIALRPPSSCSAKPNSPMVAGGQSLRLGTPRQRTLLGLLLVRAGEVVSCDRLVEDLWDGNPPPTARHTLQGYAHRLRQVLGPDAWRLATRPPGYRPKVSGW
jgi:Transcriptional regulatory protein, C terminal